MSDGLNREGFAGIEVTHDPEIAVRLVQLRLCDLCLDGAGGQCHVPGCALWIKSAPDVPIRDYVTFIDPDAEPQPAPELLASVRAHLGWIWRETTDENARQRADQALIALKDAGVG